MTKKPQYYYPDDVIKRPDGTVMLGYSHELVTDGRVSFTSRLPVTFSPADLEKLHDLYFQIWENNRIEARRAWVKEWYNATYPYDPEEDDAQQLFADAEHASGRRFSIMAFRRAHPRKQKESKE